MSTNESLSDEWTYDDVPKPRKTAETGTKIVIETEDGKTLMYPNTPAVRWLLENRKEFKEYA